MSNVIQLETSYPPTRSGRAPGDAAHIIAITEEAELMVWRKLAVKLRELETQVRKHRDALARLPDSPGKDGAIDGLTIALESIETECALCSSLVSRFRSSPDYAAPPMRTSESKGH